MKLNFSAENFVNGQMVTAGNGISLTDIGLLLELTITGFSHHLSQRVYVDNTHIANNAINDPAHQILRRKKIFFYDSEVISFDDKTYRSMQPRLESPI